LQKELSKIPRKRQVDVIIPEELKNKLDPYAVTLAQCVDRFTARSIRKISEEGKKYYELDVRPKLIGSRAMEMFLCYLKSIALKNERTVVAEEDFAEFRKLFNYFNFDLKPLAEE
jgi:hypothetical protein